MLRRRRTIFNENADRRAAVYLICLGCLSALWTGCHAPTGKKLKRDLEVALALRQVLMFPGADEVTHVVVNDNRPEREHASSVTISEPEGLRAIVTFLNDHEAAWKPYRAKLPPRPVGVTLHYPGGYQYIGTGDGFLYTRLDGTVWVRELSYLQQERFLDLLHANHGGVEEEAAKPETAEPPAETPEPAAAEDG
jgi:hypothetical protein